MKKLNSKDVAGFIDSNKGRVLDFAKSRVFDIIGGVLILGLIVLILGVFEFRKFTWQSIKEIVAMFIPFYLIVIMLATNFYTKGSYAGKSTDGFQSVIKVYSEKVNNLDGDQLDSLPEFCEYYNTKALYKLQENELKKVAIRFDRFNEYTKDKDGNELIPLKCLTKQELLQLYNKRIVAHILIAQHVRVKGVHSNILLGNSKSDDITNLGLTEKQLRNTRVFKYVIGYIGAIAFMVFIAVKDILEWGWKGLLLAAVKIIWSAVSSYLKYFQGYNDIVTSVKNHISRKIDILKEFETWYEENYANSNKNEELVINENIDNKINNENTEC